MQVVKNIFIALVSLLIAIVIFMPKQELYYKLEKSLDSYGIILNEKKIDENLFALDMSDIDVYAEGIKVAHIDNIHCFIGIFYNYIDISGVVFDKSLKSFVPLKITKADITASILNPTQATIGIDGDFGKAKGYVNINGVLHLDIIDVKDIKAFKRSLHKNGNGWYYETKF